MGVECGGGGGGGVGVKDVAGLKKAEEGRREFKTQNKERMKIDGGLLDKAKSSGNGQ